MNTVDYRCRNCGKRWRRTEPAWSCCVDHGPKQCCHAGEVRITKHGKPKMPHGGVIYRIGDIGPISSGSSSTAPWCGTCGGFHLVGFGPCNATYSFTEVGT